MVSSKACCSGACSMAEPRQLAIDLFVEDRAHEELLRALMERVAEEEGKPVVVRPRSVRGGHGRALEELVLYQQGVRKGIAGLAVPDLLVVGIDANCQRSATMRREIRRRLDPAFRDRSVVACPDPHVERWYLSDPESFEGVVGRRPRLGRKKCDRDHYKRVLSDTIKGAGHPATLRGVEFARDLAGAMDMYRAGKNDASLRLFLDEARSVLRLLARTDRLGSNPP
jgi:hypothetical protein